MPTLFAPSLFTSGVSGSALFKNTTLTFSPVLTPASPALPCAAYAGEPLAERRAAMHATL